MCASPFTIKICIIGSANYPALRGLVEIFKKRIHANVMLLDSHCFFYRLPKPFDSIFIDLVVSFSLVKTFRKMRFNAVLIYQGYMPITSLITKLFGKYLILFVGGSFFKEGFFDSSDFLYRIIAYCRVIYEHICWKISDKIVVLSKRMISWVRIENYLSKTAIALDYPHKREIFRLMIPYTNRELLIGYVGALRKCKGVLQLVDAIPYILKKRKDISFILIGDGPLREHILKRIEEVKIQKWVKMIRYVPHEKLPYWYNKMKLLVVPSFTEGLPGCILEAMSCGVPVLATAVGGIPDIIREGETGFLLKDNDPTSIAEKILKLIDNPDILEKVSRKSHEIVVNVLNEKFIEKSWREILNEVNRR